LFNTTTAQYYAIIPGALPMVITQIPESIRSGRGKIKKKSDFFWCMNKKPDAVVLLLCIDEQGYIPK
jgi:hypothetical protein